MFSSLCVVLSSILKNTTFTSKSIPTLGFQHKYSYSSFQTNVHLWYCCLLLLLFLKSMLPAWCTLNETYSVIYFFCFSFCYFEEVNSLKFAKTSKTKRKTEQKTSRYMRLVSPDLQRTRTGCLTVISVDIISNFIVNFYWHKYTIYEVVFLPFFYLGNLPYIFLSLCTNVPKNCLKLAYCVLQTCSLLIIFTSDFVNEMMMFFSGFFFFAMLIHRLV